MITSATALRRSQHTPHASADTQKEDLTMYVSPTASGPIGGEPQLFDQILRVYWTHHVNTPPPLPARHMLSRLYIGEGQKALTITHDIVADH